MIYLLLMMILSVQASHLDLCSYAPQDTACATALLCQDFPLGVCTRHTSCDQTGLCYGVVVKTASSSGLYRVKNYLTEGCPQSSFALEAELNNGACEQEVVGNYTYYARLTEGDEHKESSLGAIIGFTLMAVTIVILAVALMVMAHRKKLLCCAPKPEEPESYPFNHA